MRTVLNVQQGSTEWNVARASSDGTASELPAAAGKSKYQSRNDLLTQRKTGITKEADSSTQDLFDRGHAAEAKARQIVEELIDDELSPTTIVLEIEGLKLLASLDGITFNDEIIFEHKLWNANLAEQVNNGFLDEHYTLQMDQQLLVSGAKKCMFMTSDGTKGNCAWTWYETTDEKKAAVVAIWQQFHKDLATHEPRIIKEAPKAEPVEAFPVPSVQVRGELVACNLADITPRFDRFLETTNTDLKTDDDFAQGEADAKASREAAKNLKLKAKEVVDQIAPVSDVVRTLEAYAAKFDALGLKLEKAVKEQKEEIKSKIASNARIAYLAHIKALSDEISPIILTTGIPDFGGAMKNKRTIASLHDAVDTLLAQSKIEADSLALDIRTKLNWYKENHVQWAQLFSDMQTVIYKPFDDFKLLVETRVEQEKKRRDEERERTASAQEEADRIDAEKASQPVAAQPHDKGVIAGIQRDPVIEHQDDISAFMKSRDFGKEENRIRAVLVEFVKFSAGRQLKQAA